MDTNITPFILLTISFAVLSVFWILKSRTLKTHTGVKELKSYGVLEWIGLIYYAGFRKSGSFSGRKESRYHTTYDKYASKQSGYSKEPYLWKIFGVQIGFIVTDFDSIMEIMKNDAFYDRGPDDMLKFYSGMEKPGGIGVNNGETARELKRFLMKKFGKVGVIKKEVITSMLGDQLPYLLDRIDKLRKETNNKVPALGLFSVAVLNVVSNLAAGRVFSEDDPDFNEGFKALKEVSEINFVTMFFFWIFGNIPGVRELFKFTYRCNLRDSCHRILRGVIDEKEQLGIYKDNPSDVIEYFLQEIDKNKDNEKLKHVYCKEQLICAMQDLFITAMDTTSKFLESFMMHMCLYPEVQAKVQKEIDSVMGTSALPLYFDCKAKMPYTVATIWEVHRNTNISTVIPRQTDRDVEFKGHHLKKGCLVGCVFAALRLDDTYWEEPTLFIPDRFLDENNEIIQERVDRLLIFGHGARACPGEAIATAVAFTFAVGVLQKYNVKKGDETEILGITDKFAPINGPDPFHISFVDR